MQSAIGKASVTRAVSTFLSAAVLAATSASAQTSPPPSCEECVRAFCQPLILGGGYDGEDWWTCMQRGRQLCMIGGYGDGCPIMLAVRDRLPD